MLLSTLMSNPSNPWLPPHLRKPYNSSTAEAKYAFEIPPLPNAYNFDFPPLVPGPHSTAPWAELPADVVRLIAHRLTASEYVLMLSVCVPWASALRQPFLPLAPHFPLLAVVSHVDPHTVRLDSLREKRSFRLPLPKMPPYLPLVAPVPRPDHHCSSFCGPRITIGCVGSRGGRLVLIHNTPTVDAHIVNPITRDIIWLPSLKVLHKGKEESLRFRNVVKIALSDDTSLAMLLYKHRYLAFARAGDDVWTKLHFPLGYTVVRYGREFHDGIEDVAYHDGKFYAIFKKGHLRSFDLATASPKAKLFERSALSDKDGDDDKHEKHYGRRWLVSTPSGDLLQVRETRDQRDETEAFVIKRFDPELYSCWHYATDLMGRCALFLDGLQAIALSTEDVPGLKGNRVYFIDWRHGGVYDRMSVRMLDVGKGVIRLGFSPEHRFKVHLLPDFPLVWFMPSLI